jgi:CRISPR type I-E-associated protein CasB/Cse2
MNESAWRATLAKLRHGQGKGIKAIDLEFVLSGLDDFAGDRDQELVIIIEVLALFAKHQQGMNIKNNCMYDPKVTFCKSLQQNPNYEKGDGVRKRFQVMLSSQSTYELLKHIHSFVSLQKGIGFNYPKLAEDIYYFKDDEKRDEIRLKWSKDFYLKTINTEETENE